MKSALRKLGLAGFLFFLLKGVLWLTVPAAVVAFRGCGVEGTGQSVAGAGGVMPLAEVKQ